MSHVQASTQQQMVIYKVKIKLINFKNFFLAVHNGTDLSFHKFTYLLAHSLTPWCRIFFEKLILTQLVKQ